MTLLLVVLLLLLVLLGAGFVMLILAGSDKDKNKGWRRAGEIIVNLAVPVLLIFGIVAGVEAYEDEPIANGCTEPDLAAAEEGMAAARTVRDDHWRSVQEVEKALRAAVRAEEKNPSPAATRKVDSATRKRDKAVERLDKTRDVTVTVDETAKTSLTFDHDVNGGTRAIRFATDKRVAGGGELAVDPVVLTNDSSGRLLDADLFTVRAELDADGTNGTVFFCMIPDTRADVAAGTYSGAFVLPQGRVNRVEIPVTVTVAYHGTAAAMYVALAAILVSSWYVFFLRRPDLKQDDLLTKDDRNALEAEAEATQQNASTTPQNDPVAAEQEERLTRERANRASYALRWSFGFWQGYWRWVVTALGAITVVAGAIGAGTAFNKVYLSSTTWAGSTSDWIALIGAVATAFIAAGTAGRLAGMTFDKALTSKASDGGGSDGGHSGKVVDPGGGQPGTEPDGTENPKPPDDEVVSGDTDHAEPHPSASEPETEPDVTRSENVTPATLAPVAVAADSVARTRMSAGVRVVDVPLGNTGLTIGGVLAVERQAGDHVEAPKSEGDPPSDSAALLAALVAALLAARGVDDAGRLESPSDETDQTPPTDGT